MIRNQVALVWMLSRSGVVLGAEARKDGGALHASGGKSLPSLIGSDACNHCVSDNELLVTAEMPDLSVQSNFISSW